MKWSRVQVPPVCDSQMTNIQDLDEALCSSWGGPGGMQHPWALHLGCPYMLAPNSPTNTIILNGGQVSKHWVSLLTNIPNLYPHTPAGRLWNWCLHRELGAVLEPHSKGKDLSGTYQQRALLLHHILQSHLNTGWKKQLLYEHKSWFFFPYISIIF